MTLQQNKRHSANTAIMPRVRPETIPAIHPLPEYMASGKIAEWYQGTKEVLQVPWMGVVTMAFALYPAFFGELWRGISPLCQSEIFINECKKLREMVEAQTIGLEPINLIEELTNCGYAQREIEAIAQINDVFSHGNQPYAMIATIARYLLEIGDFGTNTGSDPYAGRHAPDVQVPFILMEAHHADQPTKDLYEDIKRTLKLPFVNTDYRAFARWPSYFSKAWTDLREKIATPAHEEICLNCHNRIVQLITDELPNPGMLNSRALKEAADKDASVGEVLEVCRLFQWLLPGLITNVAYFRHQLVIK